MIWVRAGCGLTAGRGRVNKGGERQQVGCGVDRNARRGRQQCGCDRLDGQGGEGRQQVGCNGRRERDLEGI